MNINRVILTVTDLADEVSKKTNVPSFVAEKVIRSAISLIREKKEIYVDDIYVEEFSDLFQK
jgi:hypothetical protein